MLWYQKSLQIKHNFPIAIYWFYVTLAFVSLLNQWQLDLLFPWKLDIFTRLTFWKRKYLTRNGEKGKTVFFSGATKELLFIFICLFALSSINSHFATRKLAAKVDLHITKGQMLLRVQGEEMSFLINWNKSIKFHLFSCFFAPSSTNSHFATCKLAAEVDLHKGRPFLKCDTFIWALPK